MTNFLQGLRIPLLTAMASTILLAPLPAKEVARPNILWLIAEDFGPHLSCCGTKEVWTPNLDRMASEGVRYTRFYNGHVCSAQSPLASQ
jgi:N-sulfoglucosamine sulfohydrolase